MTEHEGARTPSEAPGPGEWTTGVQTLRELLQAGAGVVSTYALREALEKKGIDDARGPRDVMRRMTVDSGVLEASALRGDDAWLDLSRPAWRREGG